MHWFLYEWILEMHCFLKPVFHCCAWISSCSSNCIFCFQVTTQKFPFFFPNYLWFNKDEVDVRFLLQAQTPQSQKHPLPSCPLSTCRAQPRPDTTNTSWFPSYTFSDIPCNLKNTTCWRLRWTYPLETLNLTKCYLKVFFSFLFHGSWSFDYFFFQ